MGVEIQRIAVGDGRNYPKKGDRVTIQYNGTLMDGTKFDSSFDRPLPFEVRIGVGDIMLLTYSIRAGWDEAVPQMSLGERSKLTITGDYGYGERGFPKLIPPNATLIL
ncbi:FK506-binding protein 1 [Tuber magnatum]|uniref:peptidylprolyl isomerase n=1 Tax=Tuber magnatum TaxID=42249 RepID=A0A317SL26_9PEZI|nr:FK506-binding protein 1 [Tuber magnatum]